MTFKLKNWRIVRFHKLFKIMQKFWNPARLRERTVKVMQSNFQSLESQLSCLKTTGRGKKMKVKQNLIFVICSVQFSRSVVSDSLQPHESQHARLPWWLKQWTVHLQATRVWSLDQKDPLEKRMATLENSSLENSMDRGAWQATVHEVTQNQTWLSN